MSVENKVLWWFLAFFVSNITVVGGLCFWVGSTVARMETTMQFMVQTDERLSVRLAKVEDWKDCLYEKQIKIQ